MKEAQTAFALSGPAERGDETGADQNAAGPCVLLLLTPEPPYTWPEPRVISGMGAYATAAPFDQALRGADALFGVVGDLDEEAVAWWETLLCESASPVRLLVALYPACATTSRQLERLDAIQGRAENVQFRLVLCEAGSRTPASLLCCRAGDPSLEFVAFGPTPIPPRRGPTALQVNLVLTAEQVLVTDCQRWFDYTWGNAVPLTQDTTDIPPLMFATGSSDAARLWQDYLAHCHKPPRDAEEAAHSSSVVIDAATGGVTLTSWDGTASPTEGMGFTDSLAATISRVYDRGALVTLDKATRLKPFDTPIDPKWFGVSSLRQIGGVKRRVGYRISAFDETTLRELDRLRSKPAELLPKFSYPLSEGVRWMPLAARPLFEAEMRRADQAGRERFEAVCGSAPEAFVRQQTDRVIADANAMCRDFNPLSTLSAQAVQEITDALCERLQAAAAGPFAPQVSYSNVRFVQYQDTVHTSTFGQAFALLHAVALLPRHAVSDRFLLIGLQCTKETLLNAMNVVDDVFVRDINSQNIIARAWSEVALIEAITELGAPLRYQCEALLDLMRGEPLNDIYDKVASAAREKKRTDEEKAY